MSVFFLSRFPSREEKTKIVKIQIFFQLLRVLGDKNRELSLLTCEFSLTKQANMVKPGQEFSRKILCCTVVMLDKLLRF